MKVMLLVLIKMYWLVPKSRRRRCLFKESCSNYVYRKTKYEGLISGIKSLNFRIMNCNPNYNLIKINEEKLLISNTQNVFIEDEINPSILK